MPIFEYHCPDCQNDFEELRALAQRDEPVACPKCSSRQPQRMISLCASALAGQTSASSCSPHGGFT